MSHQISITENGTTTLATAGKYCDRNIDVNVNVPSNEAELEEQKTITNGIVDRTITGEYVNNEILSVGAYAFNNCKSLESVIFTNATYIYAYAFDWCEALKRVELASLNPDTPSLYGNAFRNCPLLEKVIIRNNRAIKLSNVNVFSNTGISAGTGYIYVPDDLVDSYQTATNWSTYASQIKPISELEA